MKKIFLPLSFLLVSHVAISQHGSLAYKKQADSLYRHHHYQDAILSYQKALKNSNDPGVIMLQIAKSYGKINNISEAESWFEKAHSNQAVFSASDTYEYVRVLRIQEKKEEAVRILERIIAEDPNALVARQALDDIQNKSKYYKDSATYKVVGLSFNTLQAEFAPAYYQDGIVFTSAQEEKFSKKKYHWDDSHYLNLYFTKKAGETYQKPFLFERQLNTQYHDGPATFYDNFNKMVVNRNEASKVAGKDDLWIWRISLYDGKRISEGEWLVTKMPFDQPPYSFAHPAVVDNGNVLYFVSDIPGGYGGTDIYRVIRKNGIWTKPFNLGPAINTPGNEVFPYVVNNVLYFASTGHGGLGGLDIFKSTQTTNGFGPAENLGYPFNSPADDFSFITQPGQQNGYFASARRGNDDIFYFEKAAENIPFLARIYDGVTNQPLAGADVQMITSMGSDVSFISDAAGNISFELPQETTYMLIGSKDGKVGMLSGTARPEEGRSYMTHPIAAYGDTARVACIGIIKDDAGLAQNASSITIIDETTGKKLEHANQQSVVNFLGEKNHTYRIEIANEKGDTTVQVVSIGADESSRKSWSMMLKPAVEKLMFAARVFNAENNNPLGGADVKIITFSDPDQELTANADGLAEFTLPEGTAFIIVGAKDGLTGMYSGLATKKSEKSFIVHPVPAYGDPPNPVSVMTLVTDESGEIIQDAQATVTDKTTGKEISAQIDDGVLSFVGERGKEYNVAVEREGYTTILEEVAISAQAGAVEKNSISLSKQQYKLSAHVFKATDRQSLAGAQVKVLTFTEPDIELTADAQGNANFSLPEGTTFVVIGNKDGFTGMYSGTVEKEMEKLPETLPVPAHPNAEKHVTMVVRISDKDGHLLTDATVKVVDKATGETVQAIVKNGIVSFSGEKGKEYEVIVDHKDYISATKTIRIPEHAEFSEKVSVALERKGKAQQNAQVASYQTSQQTGAEKGIPSTSSTTGVSATASTAGNELLASINPVSATALVSANSNTKQETQISGLVKDPQGVVLTEAEVTVTEKQTGKEVPSTFNFGVLNFSGEKGKDYIVEVKDNEFTSVSEEIKIPTSAEPSERLYVVLERGTPDSQLPMEAIITDQKGLTELGVMVEEKAPADNDKVEVNAVVTHHDDEVKPDSAIPSMKLGKGQIPLAIKLEDVQGNPVDQAMVTVTQQSSGKEVESVLTEGTVTFPAEKGEQYAVSVDGVGIESTTKVVEVSDTPSNVQTITVEKNISTPVTYAMAVRVFKATDQSPLRGANVSVLNIVEPDLEIKTNQDGVAEFNLPDGTAFVVIGSKDGFTGMYSGEAVDGTDKTFAIHPVPAYGDSENQTPVVAFITDGQGSTIPNATVLVFEKSTGKAVPVESGNGVLSFVAEKGKEYRVEVRADGFAPFEKTIEVPAQSTSIPNYQIDLVPADVTPTGPSSLIVLNTDGGTEKFYLVSENKLEAVTSKNGRLYAQSDAGVRALGKGTEVDLKRNAATLGTTPPEDVISINTIYFDFNSAALSEEGKQELNKVHRFFERYPGLRFDIGTHADDRGKSAYNLNLSRKRARSIESYLEKQGVEPKRLKIVAFGETTPAIRCQTCTEAEHQKNRRAEFALGVYDRSIIPANKPSRKGRMKNEELLAAYGDVQKEGLLFKVSIGAYRFNSTLTFEELKDLGAIETNVDGGITYYYLSGYPTWRIALGIREKVIGRGVRDAAITIFYNGEKISFSTFKSLND